MAERAGAFCARAAALLAAAVLVLGAVIATARAQTAGPAADAPAAVTAAPQAVPLSDDPALEAEVMRIAHDLRCLVCQNETIAASNADLAVDLRGQIRSQLRAGRNEREIIDGLFAKIGQAEAGSGPRDPEAERHIAGLVAARPAAPYYMAQAILVGGAQQLRP